MIITLGGGSKSATASESTSGSKSTADSESVIGTEFATASTSVPASVSRLVPVLRGNDLAEGYIF